MEALQALNGINAVTLGKLLKVNMLAANMFSFSNFPRVTALLPINKFLTSCAVLAANRILLVCHFTLVCKLPHFSMHSGGYVLICQHVTLLCECR